MRYKIIIFFVFIFYFVLIYRTYDLSIVSNKKYLNLSKDNYTKVVPIAPVRGIVFDRFGNTLAFNELRFDLDLRAHLKKEELKSTINDIADVLDVNKTKIYNIYKNQNSPYNNKDIPVIKYITEEKVFKIEPVLSLNPNIAFKTVYLRKYPYKYFLSNVLGYVARANKKDLKRNKVIEYTQIAGKRGIEAYYDNILQGEAGKKIEIVNARNRVLKVVKYIPPKSNNITLTIDTNLQKYIYNTMMKEKKRGAVVVMRTNGEIVALVSTPSYDNNLFVKGISTKEWHKLAYNIYNPLLNKPVSGLYPPGSTVKPAEALIAAASGKWNPWKKIECPGFIEIGHRKFRDWLPWGHGKTDIIKAIKESVDTYFYQVGLKLGIDYLAKNFKKMGFGKKTGIDLPNEKSGIVPNKEWKEKRYHQPWFLGDTVNASIGQGYFLVTPIQIAVDTALLASGKLPKPFIVEKIDNNLTKPVLKDVLNKKEKKSLWIVRKGMWEVCNAPGGTATRHIHTKITIAGKTGTAQVYYIPQIVKKRKKENELSYFHRSHSWLTTFGPYKHPQFVVTVLIEHGGHQGGKIAGDIVSNIYNYLVDKGYIK